LADRKGIEPEKPVIIIIIIFFNEKLTITKHYKRQKLNTMPLCHTPAKVFFHNNWRERNKVKPSLTSKTEKGNEWRELIKSLPSP